MAAIKRFGATATFRRILLTTAQHFGVSIHVPQPNHLWFGSEFKDPIRWRERHTAMNHCVVSSHRLGKHGGQP